MCSPSAADAIRSVHTPLPTLAVEGRSQNGSSDPHLLILMALVIPSPSDTGFYPMEYGKVGNVTSMVRLQNILTSFLLEDSLAGFRKQADILERFMGQKAGKNPVNRWQGANTLSPTARMDMSPAHHHISSSEMDSSPAEPSDETRTLVNTFTAAS